MKHKSIDLPFRKSTLAASLATATVAIASTAMVSTVAMAAGGVVCDGTGHTIQGAEGTGLWLQSLPIINNTPNPNAPKLQNRTPVASGGPNLILNGDFTYGAGFTFNEAASLQPLPDASYGDGVYTNPGDGYYSWVRAVSPHTDGGSVGYPYVAMNNWTSTGGGSQTYAGWGAMGALYNNGTPADTTDDYMPWGWNPEHAPKTVPPLMAGVTPPDFSMVYFGNTTDWAYKDSSLTGAEVGAKIFDANGFGQSNTLQIYNKNSDPSTFGPADGSDPVKISQIISLTPGVRYRLQFWQSSEDGDQDPLDDTPWSLVGTAALDITGYNRTYFTLPQPGGYRTIDFVATAASTTISFMSWGHVNLYGPQKTPNDDGTSDPHATELIMDDVILTQCQGPAVSKPDMAINLSGMPTSASVDQAYTGNFTCSNVGSGDTTANTACGLSGLPVGLNVSSCTVTPGNQAWASGSNVGAGQTVTCQVSGKPTVAGTASVNGTTGTDADADAGNNSAGLSLAVAEVPIESTPIPTLTERAMFLMSLMMIGVAGWHTRRSTRP